MHPKGSVRCKPQSVKKKFCSELITLFLVYVLRWRLPRRSSQEASTTVFGYYSSCRGCWCFCPQDHLKLGTSGIQKKPPTNNNNNNKVKWCVGREGTAEALYSLPKVCVLLSMVERGKGQYFCRSS